MNQPARHHHIHETTILAAADAGFPVVLTDLARGDRIDLDRIGTVIETVIERFGPLAVDTRQSNPPGLLLDGPLEEPQASTVEELIRHLSSDPTSDLVCSEFPTPEPLRALLPTLWPDREHLDDDISQLFIANQGSHAHLHYDGDLRHVVMFPVFGAKRYTVIHHRFSPLLNEIHHPEITRTSGVYLQHLSEDLRSRLLESVDAVTVELQPDEALLMPRGCWHFVEYDGLALSVNLRLGRYPELRRMAACGLWSSDAVTLASIVAQGGDRSLRILDALETVNERFPLSTHRRAALTVVGRELLAEHDNDFDSRPDDVETLRRLSDANRQLHSAEPDSRSIDATQLSADIVVTVPPGVTLLVPLTGGAVAFAEGDLLVGEIPVDPDHPWTLSVLAHLARGGQPIRVSDLAQRAHAPLDGLVAFLQHLRTTGWITW